MELSAFISKERKSLPPGFRFHPTDVELVMYYLKRKVMGKKLREDVIADINIYQFSPWDLPDLSSLKSRDLEWFFFCPKEKKYARGARVKRATEKGYWKTTGKCRNIYSGDKVVGTVTTLVFHLGHAPQGERTDWVNHEYKIIDAQLAAIGLEDTYVLCKVFKKNGPGPKVGAQYGAPFDEEEWSSDDLELSETHAASSSPNVRSPLIHEITSDALFMGQCSNVKQISPAIVMPHPGSTSGPSLVESLQPSPQAIASVLDQEFDDDIDRFLASFTDDPSLLKNGHQEDAVIHMTQKMSAPCLDGYDVYGGLLGLGNISAPVDQPGFNLSGMPKGIDTFPHMLMHDSSDYIELNDLDMPLPNSSTETLGNGQPYDVTGSYSLNYVPQFFSGINHPASCIDQSPMISAQSNNGNSGMEDISQVNHFCLGSNAVFGPLTYKLSSNGESASCLINEDMFGSSSR